MRFGMLVIVWTRSARNRNCNFRGLLPWDVQIFHVVGQESAPKYEDNCPISRRRRIHKVLSHLYPSSFFSVPKFETLDCKLPALRNSCPVAGIPSSHWKWGLATWNLSSWRFEMLVIENRNHLLENVHSHLQKTRDHLRYAFAICNSQSSVFCSNMRLHLSKSLRWMHMWG